MTERSIDLSVEVPGTPEEVWAAIATGPGISSWFVPCVVDEDAGTITLDFGPHGVDVSRVDASEPPRRFVGTSPDGQFASEWLVEARDKGTCVVRLVQSGFGSDEERDAVTFGWALFFANLRLHLAHFAGQTGTPVQPLGVMAGKADEVWGTVCERLGLQPRLEADQPLHASGLRGTVAVAQPTAYIALLDEPLPGTAIIACEPAGDQTMVSLFLYLYGAADDVEAARTQWTATATAAIG